MATILSHAVAAAAMGSVYAGDRPMPAAFWTAAAVCAILPDADVVGFSFGIRYGDVLGHRGFSHSFIFAILIALLAAWGLRGTVPWKSFLSLTIFFSLVTASHALIDAFTNGGLGVALFSPFDLKRYFFPWRPIEVSPIGIGAFLTERGLAVILNEVRWIWLPSIALFSLGRFRHGV
jgi:inner membrane protein